MKSGTCLLLLVSFICEAQINKIVIRNNDSICNFKVTKKGNLIEDSLYTIWHIKLTGVDAKIRKKMVDTLRIFPSRNSLIPQDIQIRQKFEQFCRVKNHKLQEVILTERKERFKCVEVELRFIATKKTNKQKQKKQRISK